MNTKEQFELWAKNQNSDLSIWTRGVKSGTYKNPVVGKMLEAWQAASKASEQQLSESRREFTAANATIHNLELKLADMAVQLANAESKCRELAGVVAENAALKKAAEFATAPDMWIEQADGMLDYRYCEWYVDVLKAAMETPATEAFLAEVRAQGVDYFAADTGRLYQTFSPSSAQAKALKSMVYRETASPGEVLNEHSSQD